MREILLSEILSIQLDILSSVDIYCRQKGIKYFLLGGTCIGAVRHHGYIPWDDDIDIGMTRPYYERFIREYNSDQEKDPNLRVFAPELNWDYYAPYANICDTRTVLDEGSNGHHGIEIGIKIDLFPVDGIPSDLRAFHKEKEMMSKLWNALYLKRVTIDKERPFKWKLITFSRKFLLFPFRYSTIQKMIRRLALSNKYEDAEFAVEVVFPWKRDVMCEKCVFEDLVEIRFENISVLIMSNYDRYLTLKYGDYMELPPEDQRIAHHGFKAFWKE